MDEGGGGIAWTNPSHAAGACDSSVAQVVLTTPFNSNYLKATGFGFGIGAGEIIVGIEVDIRLRSNSNWVKDLHVYLLKAGSGVGSDYKKAAVYPTTLTHELYGGAADLWGTSWAPSDINDANFGVHIASMDMSSSGYVAQIDCITITVTTTYPHVDVSDSGSGVEGSIVPSLLMGEVGSGSELFGKAFPVSDLGHGVEATNIGYTLAFGVADSGSGRESADHIEPHPPAPFGIQDLNLPHVLTIRRTSGSQLGLLPLPGRGFQYARQLSAVGDVWEFTGLVDRAKLEELLALNGTVWFSDPVYGNFHATIEVDASWVASDAPDLERDATS